ncbi:MAG: tetratricopeptide repeat protein [Myxococcota bacterium]
MLVLLAVVFAATPAWSQVPDGSAGERETVEPTDEQARLNDQGVRALGEEDYVKAISLLEEARYLGELNITYLNLGRAYQLAGRCEKARESLQKVFAAPKVEKPPAGLIESKAREFLEVLESTCPAESSKSDGQDRSSTRTAGIITTSLGGAMMAGAVGLHFLWAEQIRRDATDGLPTDEPVTRTSQRAFYRERDRANTIDTVALGTAIVGGAATGIGLYLWLSDKEAESTSHFQIAPSNHGIQAAWTLRF